MSMDPLRSEADLVVERYSRRGATDLYSVLRSEVWHAMQERQRGILQLLAANAPRAVDTLRVLEIGCGSGNNLQELLRLGFDPANLVGNELLPDRARAARRSLPTATAVYGGDALELALPDASFDIIYQSTVFTSLLDDDFRRRLANCMWRWVRPGGGVLWYDFVYDNPANPDVRGVPLRCIRELFPDGRLSVKRVTLAPPIARRVVRVHPSLYTLFNAIPLLRTHLLAWIGKPSSPQFP